MKISLFILMLMMVSCSNGTNPTATPSPYPTATSSPSVTPTPTAVPSPSPTPLTDHLYTLKVSGLLPYKHVIVGDTVVGHTVYDADTWDHLTTTNPNTNPVSYSINSYQAVSCVTITQPGSLTAQLLKDSSLIKQVTVSYATDPTTGLYDLHGSTWCYTDGWGVIYP